MNGAWWGLLGAGAGFILFLIMLVSSLVSRREFTEDEEYGE